MKKEIWIQTVIIFIEDAKNQYDKTFKSMDRFYTLSRFNYFVSKKTNNFFNKWFCTYKRIQKKINEKEITYNHARELYFSCWFSFEKP